MSACRKADWDRQTAVIGCSLRTPKMTDTVRVGHKSCLHHWSGCHASENPSSPPQLGLRPSLIGSGFRQMSRERKRLSSSTTCCASKRANESFPKTQRAINQEVVLYFLLLKLMWEISG